MLTLYIPLFRAKYLINKLVASYLTVQTPVYISIYIYSNIVFRNKLKPTSSGFVRSYFCKFCEESQASTETSTNNDRFFYVAVTQFANLIIANTSYC